MRRLLLALLGLATAALTATLAPAADKKSVLGKVQPEIRLTDGTIFKQAKIIDYSLDKSTATIADPTRIRTVALDTLPPPLRDQLLAEAGVKPTDPRRASNPARLPAHPRPPLHPTQNPSSGIAAPPPLATTASGKPFSREQLLQQATTATPDQLKAHLTRTYGQVGGFTAKILETAEVPGWPRLRVTGETTFTERTPGARASSLRREKFELEYSIVEGVLQPTTVTIGGIATPFSPP